MEATITLGELFSVERAAVDPARFPNEPFALFSIPAHDSGAPELINGNAIGSAKQLVRAGDVLLSRIVPHIRRTWVVESQGNRRLLASTEWLVFASDRVEPEYLRFALLSDQFHREFMTTVGGVGGSLLRAQREQVAQLEIPHPALDEQRAVAAALRIVSRGIALERAVTAQVGDLKLGLMRQIFTRGLRGEAQKESEIGPIPESWEAKPLSSLGTFYSGGTPPKGDHSLWGGSVPWASGKDLKSPKLGDTVDHISIDAAEDYSRVVPAGSVLVLVRGMGLAKRLPLSLLEKPMAFNQDIKALAPKATLSGRYLAHALTNAEFRMLQKTTSAAHGTKRLTQDDLESFLVPVPFPAEAEEIADILDAIGDGLRLHEQKRAVLEELFQSLLNGLMSGEIDVNDLDFSALETPA